MVFKFAPVYSSGLKRPQYHVDGTVAESAVTTIYGPAKCGKGYWTLSQIIIPCALKGVRPTVLSLEDKYVLADRAMAYNEYHNTEVKEFTHLVSGVPNLLNDMHVGFLIKELEKLGTDVLVIDPLRIAIGGADEDRSSTAALFYMSCRRIIEEVGCSVVVNHHTGKPQSGADNKRVRSRGSQAWQDLTDIEISLRPSNGLLIAENTANRFSAKWGQKVYEFIPVPKLGERVCVPTDKEAPKVTNLATERKIEREEDIIAFIKENANWTGMVSFAEIRDGLDMKEHTLTRSLKSMVASAKIERVVKGKYRLPKDSNKQQ